MTTFRHGDGGWNPLPKQAFSGPRWALEIATEVSRYPDVIDPRLLAQAEAYSKLGGAWQYMGKSRQEAADLLVSEGKKFSGWNKNVVFESLHGFEPGPEERAMLGAFGEEANFGGREWATRWNKSALLNKYTRAVGGSQSLADIASQAGRAGLGAEWRERVSAQRPELIGDLADLTKRQVAARASRPLASNAWRLLKKARWPAMGVAAAGAAYAIQPLSIFSGKDDAYNTIEGLPHGGQAELLRKKLTDFGSGFRGILNIPKILQGPARRANIVGFTGTSKEALALIGGQMKKEIPALSRRGAGALRGIEKQKQALNTLISEMQASPFKQTVLINPSAIRSEARALGVSESRFLKGTIQHERFHQTVAEYGLHEGKKIAGATVNVPRTFRKQLEASYKQAGRQISPAEVREEYLAYGLSNQYTQIDPKLFTEAQKTHEAIAANIQQRIAQRTEKFHRIHREGVIRASANALRPGKRHRGQAGKLVL